MKLTHALLGVAFSAILVASVVPALASAQAFNPAYGCGNSFNYYNWGLFNNNNVPCQQGELLVYVTVTNDYNNYYNNTYNNTAYTNAQPQNFIVTVSGQNVSPSTFPGSLSATPVLVGGSYSVSTAQLPGYTATYSSGCTGTVVQGQQSTCIITESNTSNYYPNVTPYPYPYYNTALSCSPSTQTVGLGQTATFSISGGQSGPYNWVTPNNTYLAIGPTLSTSFPSTGTQTVTVSNSSGSASCTVNVVAGYYPTTTGINTAYPTVSYTTPGSVYVTPTYVPALPNTGFAPMGSASIAFGVVALIALALLASPYVRYAFAAALS